MKNITKKRTIFIKTLPKNSSGYTLVETLIGMAILAGVLIPTVIFLGRITMTQRVSYKMTAFFLAEEEMEQTLGFNLFSDSEREITFNSKVWRIVKKIREEQGLIMIRVEVYLREKARPLSVIETMRILK